MSANSFDDLVNLFGRNLLHFTTFNIYGLVNDGAGMPLDCRRLH